MRTGPAVCRGRHAIPRNLPAPSHCQPPVDADGAAASSDITRASFRQAAYFLAIFSSGTTVILDA